MVVVHPCCERGHVTCQTRMWNVEMVSHSKSKLHGWHEWIQKSLRAEHSIGRTPILHPKIYYTPWKMMLGRRLAFLLGPGLFSGAIYVKIPGCSWWVVTFNIFLPSRSRSFKTSPRSFSTSVADRIDFKFKSGLQRFEYGKIYSKKLFQNII